MKFPFAAFLSCVLALAQTMTIEEYEPKSTLVVPQHPVQRAENAFASIETPRASQAPERSYQGGPKVNY